MHLSGQHSGAAIVAPSAGRLADGSGGPPKGIWKPAYLPEQLWTGCVYEAQPNDTFGLLVTRMRPRRGAVAMIHDAWADLAPSVLLLTGRTSGGDRGNRGGGHGRRGARIHLGWESFAAAYRAELDALPERVRMEANLQFAWWLRTYASVTLLSFEHVPDDSETRALTQRRILRDWLLGRPLQIASA